MPTQARLDAFIAHVVSGDHVGAVRDFYAADATMRENLKEPRRGREVLMENEARALARLDRMVTHPPKAIVLDGDRVAIHWMFDAVGKDGVTRRLEELALQRWEGDRIAEEQFFYDTATAWGLVD
jgi:ketosteroid isomerase-like protein